MSTHKKSAVHLKYIEKSNSITPEKIIEYLRKIGKSEEFINKFTVELATVEI
jgi:hypothetical protein